jgi:hypothetical protein
MSSCDLLHEPVNSDGSRVDGEGSHEADTVTFKEGFPSSDSELLSETLSHVFVLEIAQLVRLHQSLDVVEGIVEDPVTGAAHTTSNDGYVDWHIIFVNIRRSQIASQVLNEREIKAKSSAFADCGGALASVQSFESVLLEDFKGCIEGA